MNSRENWLCLGFFQESSLKTEMPALHYCSQPWCQTPQGISLDQHGKKNRVVVEISHQKQTMEIHQKRDDGGKLKNTHIILLGLNDNPKRIKQDEANQQFRFIGLSINDKWSHTKYIQQSSSMKYPKESVESIDTSRYIKWQTNQTVIPKEILWELRQSWSTNHR